MKTNFRIIMVLFLAAAVSLSFGMPKGWFAAGSDPGKYEMGTDPGAGADGTNCATIRSKDSKKHRGFGTLMQNTMPGKYLGKRIRMTGYMKSVNVVDWAGFWLRVDGPGSRGLSFDNMSDRPVKGSTDWKQYEIVLDVPAEATNIAYGALLGSTGQIWFDNIKFEIVESKVPVTGNSPSEPANLDFNE